MYVTCPLVPYAGYQLISCHNSLFVMLDVIVSLECIYILKSFLYFYIIKITNVLNKVLKVYRFYIIAFFGYPLECVDHYLSRSLVEYD